jgi:hypothetical protein
MTLTKKPGRIMSIKPIALQQSTRGRSAKKTSRVQKFRKIRFLLEVLSLPNRGVRF